MLKKTGRRTIGVIVEALHESYQSCVWQGIAEQAQQLDYNLIAYVSTSKDRLTALHKHYMIIQDMISTESLQGLIIFTGAMAEYFPQQQIRQFCQRFEQLPLVSIALKIDGIPSILVDNRTGIIAGVTHLIQIHKLRRIAFIKGPEGHDEAETRYAAYCVGLSQNQIPFDPTLIFAGNFTDESGVNAAQQIIAQQLDIQAIIAADDASAIGAVSELRRLGKSVPYDIAVIGFDDIIDGQFLRPALTTVQQPMKDQGSTAIRLIDQMINKKPFSMETYMPTRFIARQSCGCFSEIIQNLHLRLHTESPSSPLSVPPQDYNQVAAAIVQESLTQFQIPQLSVVPIDTVTLSLWLHQLGEAFAEATSGTIAIDEALHTLDTILMLYADSGGDVEIWHRVLTITNNTFSQFIHDGADRNRFDHLFHKARILVSDLVLINVQYKTMQREQLIIQIRQVCQKLITTFDLRMLSEVIVTQFPHLSIDFCLIGLYAMGSEAVTVSDWTIPERSRLFVFFDGDRRSEKKGEIVEFKTAELIPENKCCPIQTNRKVLIFLPLFFNDEHFGYMLLNHVAEAPNFLYEEIRLHLGSAIKSTYLLERLKDMSLHDSLTGLFNRRGFITLGQQQLLSARRESKTIFIMYADVDNLKHINDTYGHLEGDQAIITTAQLLKKTLRTSDIVARIGGDEFTFLVVGIDEAKANLIIKRISDHFDKYNASHPKPYTLSISIGTTFYDSTAQFSFEEMLKTADSVLIDNKRFRKNHPPPDHSSNIKE
ncbi:MAG: GGDEF domain-containing protein [Chitinivibrionales bacterium]|nr:GGDEF domain-containing protein [Chitinivibrionales bacterium]